ncbi:MAG: large subunit ribosomal protein L30e [Thermoproteota archaeon]|nr:large subunit ribosomal protein L30e [Thermoproteota archaeon]
MMIDVDRIINSALKSGRVYLGFKQTKNAAKTGKAVALILSSNCSVKLQKDIQQYATLSKTPLLIYHGTSQDLGVACGKPFIVSAMTIRNLTDSQLLKSIKESNEQTEQA